MNIQNQNQNQNQNQATITNSQSCLKVKPNSKIPLSNTSKNDTVFQTHTLKHEGSPLIGTKFVSTNTRSSTIESQSNLKEIINNINENKVEDKYLSSLYNKYNYLKEKINKEGVIKQVKKSQLLSPIPSVRKKENHNKGQERLMNDAITNAIVLRRLEYDEYIKHSKIKNSKRKTKKIHLIRKRSFDEKKVVEIQKMYKGFSTRIVNKSISRLKIRSCLVETFCLLLSLRFESASKRFALAKLKKWFYEPFNSINDEVGLSDKLQVKLFNNYYSFRTFKDLSKTIE